MNTGNEDFEKLRKLLKLKRHEQPPPGYFAGFPDHVMARLEADGEEARDAGKLVDSPWLRKFLRMLDANPFLAGALGTLICASLIAGIMFSQQGDDRAAIGPAAIGVEYASAPMEQPAQTVASDSLHPAGSFVFGTNASSPSLSDFGAQLQPASFAVPAN
jgi:hypothetical protein